MANNNFVVQNGLTVGPLTIDASTGSITTTGAIATSGASPRISQNASNVIATANFVNVAVNGANIASFGAGGLNLLSVGLYAGGSTGSAGQVLKSTGTGLEWASADQILNGGSNVRVTSDWVNVSVKGSNVASFGSSYATIATYLNAVGNISTPQLNAGQLNTTGNVVAVVAKVGSLESTGVVYANSTAASTSTTSGALIVAGGAGIAGNVFIGGNLYIAGNLTTVNTSTLTIDDPMIYLAANNAADSVDIGLVGHFINPGYQHTGFVRDASDTVWKLFANVTTEPSTTIDFTNAIYQPILTGTHTISGGFLNVGGNILATGAVVNALTVNGTTTAQAINSSGVLNTSGNVLTAALITSTATVNSTSTFNGAPTINAQLNTRDVIPNASNTYSVGSTTTWYNSFWGKAVNAQYADLAEKYQADAEYTPGTVLMFGGAAEVTLADSETQRVAGVVSTDPAYLMNGLLNGENTVALALTGRVPCRVTGTIRKGDMLTSSGNGFAHANPEPKLGAVIGKALEDFDGLEGVIEVVVGRL